MKNYGRQMSSDFTFHRTLRAEFFWKTNMITITGDDKTDIKILVVKIQEKRTEW